MTAETAFAIGTGIACGLLLNRLFSWVSPTAIERICKSFAEQLSHAKEDARQEVARLQESITRERGDWRNLVDSLQNQARALLERKVGEGVATPSQIQKILTPPPATSIPPPTNGTTDHQRLADKLRQIPGVSPERAADAASKILAGDTEDLGLDPLTATLAEGIIREETGAV